MLRFGLSLAAGAALIFVLVGRLGAIEPAEVALAFASISPFAWVLALVATVVSFWAVGQYDVVIHAHFRTGQHPRDSRLAGICAIAVSQMIGMGVVVGAILRWRMLPGTSLGQATKLTAVVALSFLAAWSVFTSVVLIFLPLAPFKGTARVVLCIGICLILTALIAPYLRSWRFRWPNGFTLSRLLVLCVVDTLAAASAFYALCPPDIHLAFSLLLPGFLLALGAGLVSGAPGGVGAFELAMLALLPAQSEPELLAAILAWRMVYFALPAVIGAGLAIRGPHRTGPARLPPADLQACICAAAETQISRQAAHRVIGNTDQGIWLTGSTPHCLVAMFSAIRQPKGADTAIKLLSRAARAQSRLAVLYKSPPRLAAAARRLGFMVLSIAREAVVNPVSYDLGRSCRGGLRRKLRRAEASGVRILPPGTAPDWPALDRIAAAWAAGHGGERGFSMGRYDPRYIHGQRLYIAELNDQPLAFVTFHEGHEEWVLDLMRHLPGIPDGTMHLLVQTAIDDAGSAGIRRLSLAAVPETAFWAREGWRRRLIAAFLSDSGAGLARFKSAFAPVWEPRYLCLPRRSALPLVLAELAFAIHRPAPLPNAPDLSVPEGNKPEYAFASAL